MPEIELTETFKKLYDDLPVSIQNKVNKSLRLLAENPRYPSLRSKPIEEAPGIYEASADMQYHMTYERLPGNVLRLRVVGKHDEALKNP